MPKYTSKPNAGPLADRSSSKLTLTGTTNPVTALGDASDSTYGKLASSTLPADYAGTIAAVGAGERIVALCPYCRARMPGTKQVSVTLGQRYYHVYRPGYAAWLIAEGVKLTLNPNGSIAAYEISPAGGSPVSLETTYWGTSGGLWAAGDTWTLSFRDPHTAAANLASWYEAGVYVYTLKPAAVAAPSAPSGTITTTQYPAVAATISAVVDSWQVPAGGDTIDTSVFAYFAIYREADVGTATSPPPGITPLWAGSVAVDVANYIDGATASTAVAGLTPDLALANGNYVVFVCAGRDAGAAGLVYDSGWAHTHFVQNVALPTAPTFTPTADEAGQRITLTVNAPATTGYDSATGQIEVQRLVSGVWRDVRLVSGSAITIGSSVVAGYDYEGARAATNTYRARSSMILTADGVRKYSAWTQATAAGPTVAGWNLKTVDVPASSWIAAPVLTEPGETAQGSSTVLEPLDRDFPIVVSGMTGGAGGALQILASGATAIAAAEALRLYAGVVYLETAFGDARYIRLLRSSWVRQGTNAAPRREYAFEYAEVGSGLSTDAT